MEFTRILHSSAAQRCDRFGSSLFTVKNCIEVSFFWRCFSCAALKLDPISLSRTHTPVKFAQASEKFCHGRQKLSLKKRFYAHCTVTLCIGVCTFLHVWCFRRSCSLHRRERKFVASCAGFHLLTPPSRTISTITRVVAAYLRYG